MNERKTEAKPSKKSIEEIVKHSKAPRSSLEWLDGRSVISVLSRFCTSVVRRHCRWVIHVTSK